MFILRKTNNDKEIGYVTSTVHKQLAQFYVYVVLTLYLNYFSSINGNLLGRHLIVELHISFNRNGFIYRVSFYFISWTSSKEGRGWGDIFKSQ